MSDDDVYAPQWAVRGLSRCRRGDQMRVNAHLDVDLVALESEDEVAVLLELEPSAAGVRVRWRRA